MLKRKLLILAILTVSLLSISIVTAADNSSMELATIDNSTIEIMAAEDSQLILTENDGTFGTFNELSQSVNSISEGNTLNLDKNYKNIEGSDGIIIDRTITIDGQGHTIDADYKSRTFYINSSSVTLKNIKFINGKFNGEGGAFYVAPNSCLNIVNSSFVNCSGLYGGAINLGENSTLTVDGSYFTNCFAEAGGAIFAQSGSALTVSNSSFDNNVAEIIGGSILASSNNRVSLFTTNFTNSSASHESGGAFAIIRSDLKAEYIEVIDCSSIFGGAVTLLSSNSTIGHSTFKRNSASYDGGAIFAMYGSINFTDNEFSRSHAKRGGALYVSLLNITLINDRFISNSASNGGAIYAMACDDKIIENITFTDNEGSPQANFYETINDNLTITSGNYSQFTLQNVNYTSLPDSYSLLDYGLLTPVKNQGTEGNCWAFSAIAVLESCIMKASGIPFDLSEANLKNMMALYSDYGRDILTNDGGMPEMTQGYLASWLGPIFDVDDFYSINDYLSPLLSSIIHVQNIVFLKRENFTDNNDFKDAIMRYGAVSTTMYYDSDYLNRYSYFYDGNESTNHAVSIVGWDDNYSRNNFDNAPGDGAWIVRNSWGPSWGNKGYFYVSYYDTRFAQVNNTVSYTFILNDTIKFDRNYQHEIERTSKYNLEINEASYKSIFTVEGEEYLAAVSTYFLEKCDYKVDVYIGDILTSTKTGKANAGYYTINLDDLIYLDKNDIVTVVFNCTNFTSGFGSIPCSLKSVNNNLYIKEGVSYYWNGKSWRDFYSLGVVASIKMFTTFSTHKKINPTFQVSCQNDHSDNSYIITAVLSKDATGSVSVYVGGREYVINLSTSKSIKLYNLDENNNTLFLRYSGDDRYLEKSLEYTVELMTESGSFKELANEISKLNEGDIFILHKDFIFDSSSDSTIVLRQSVTIDGNGHTISAEGSTVIMDLMSDDIHLKNIYFTGGSYKFGAAIYIAGSGCSILNCTFVNNSASDHGGAIYWAGADGVLSGCSFENNSAQIGGAVYIFNNSCTVTDCSFINNSAEYGSAIFILNVTTMENCSFVNNSASNAGTVYWDGDHGVLSGCSFVNNYATNYGGAIRWVGSDGKITDSEFIANSASYGGAIHFYGDNGVLSNCSFEDNVASVYGGSVYWQGNNGQLSDSCFTNNSALVAGAVSWVGNGGKIIGSEFTSNFVSNYSGAVYWYGDDGVLTNCSFANNSADDGGAIRWVGDRGSLSDSKFTSNSASYGGAVYFSGNDGVLSNGLFEDNFASVYGGAIYWSEQGGQLSDSIFANNSATYGGAVCWVGDSGKMTTSEFYNNSVSSHGGGIYWYGKDGILDKCSFANHSAAYGGALYWSGNNGKSLDCNFANGSADNYGGNVYWYGDDGTLNGGTFSGSSATYGGAVFWSGDKGNLIDSTFINPLNVNQIYWNAYSGNIMTCNFLNSTKNNIVKNGATVIKNNINLTCGASSFEYNHPEGLQLNSNNLPTVSQSTFKLTKGSTVKTFTAYINDIEEIYSQLAKLNLGTWNLAVSFGGDDNYNVFDKTFTFKVTPAYTSLVISAGNASVAHKTTITATALDCDNMAVNEGSVIFYDGETRIGQISVSNGAAALEYTPAASGIHTIRAVFSSDNYLSSENSAELLVDDVDIKILAEAGIVGFTSAINVSIKGLYSQITEGSVSLYVNSAFVAKQNIDRGNASFSYVPLSAGRNAVKVVFGDNPRFSNRESSTYMTVNPADSQLTIDNVSGIVSDDLTLKANVIGSNNLIVDDGIVKFFEDGVLIGSSNVKNGAAILAYSPAKSGNHVISAQFISNNYNPSTGEIEISIGKAKTEMTLNAADVYYDNLATFTAEILSNGKPVNEGIVTFYLNGEEMAPVNVKNGHASFEYRPVSLDALNISAVFNSTDNYFASDDAATVTVNKLPTRIMADDINTVFNAGKYLTVTLKDMNNKPLKGITVSISFNGVKIKATDANGQVKLSTNGLKPMKYAVTITFGGNGYYLKSTKNVNVILKKAAPKLTAAKKTFKRKIKIKKYTVTLKNNKNKAIAKSKVILKVKGKKYTVKTNSKGKATFKITNLKKKGSFKATVTFNGDKYYNKVTKKVKIKIK